ncbi:MAG: DNA polymerase III subunit alpha [Candidatus Marinimicrobia bacterium]|nr:DNA polymerase III subunit alpha [Candidatus Neomarinimicrobiota bacterium]
MFVHLNIHSNYSKMYSSNTFKEYLQTAKKQDMQYMAITEVNGLWGFIHFIHLAKNYGIKPIAGTNLITKNHESILLAKNKNGYSNICKILSAQHLNSNFSLIQSLKEYNDGIFILSHKIETLKQLDFIPKSQLFIELCPEVDEFLVKEWEKSLKIKSIATGDVYFMKKADERTHRILRAIHHNTTLSRLDKSEYKSDNHWFRNESEMKDLFPNSIEAIENSYKIAQQCKTDWDFSNTIFPSIHRDGNRTNHPNKTLRKLTIQGAKKRYQHITDKIQKRIEYELELIIKKGYSAYFLIVYDIVKQTKSTIGRGSGAASIVSYCLMITQVDPIKYNLQFERFIHPERIDMPDIDIDFPWDERDDILKYIFKTYGIKYTAMVSNQVFLQPRSAIREVSKVYGLSNEEIKSITKRISYYKKYQKLVNWIQTDERFKNIEIDKILEEILLESEKIIGVFRNSSVHPGGVIIVPNEIKKYVPVLKTLKNVQVVEWEKNQVEAAGLLKIDILGNRSLSVVRDTIKQLGLYRNNYMDYHQIQSTDDPQTIALMKSGRTMGIFYIESPATRQILAKSKMIDFEHVVIYSSIIRPAANRFITLMLKRIHGEPWELLHPDLHCLAESYGIIVYQEQISTIARDIAGFSYSDSDYIRKVISRISLTHTIPYWKNKFIKGTKKNGYNTEIAEELWTMIESFSGYSFCKPHSASYAMLSFTCAYLKAHFPAEFIASVISNQGGFYSSYAYMSEAKRFGIKILKPHINLSLKHYKGKYNKIRMGFMAINRLQEKAIKKILDERKNGYFRSLDDFLLRTKIDLTDAMSLVKAGCFEELCSKINYREITLKVASFYLQSSEDRIPIKINVNTVARTQEERILLEFESFGFPISEHPLYRYKAHLQHHVQKAKNIHKMCDYKVVFAGVLITRKITATQKNEAMEFITFEDETDIFECVIFPKVYKLYGDLLNWEKLFLVYGKVEKLFDVYTVTISRLESLQRKFDIKLLR